jgi:hypothetical protein
LLLFGVTNVAANGCQFPYCPGPDGCIVCDPVAPLIAHTKVLVAIIVALLGVIFVQYRRISELTSTAKALEKK